MKLVSAATLSVLGCYLIYLGWNAPLPAPIATAAGFFVIAATQVSEYLDRRSRLPRH